MTNLLCSKYSLLNQIAKSYLNATTLTFLINAPGHGGVTLADHTHSNFFF